MTKKINLILIILMALGIVNVDVNSPAAEAGETGGCDHFDRWTWIEDHAYSGWGLAGIQERAGLLGGKYVIDSTPGRGSRVWVSVPLVARATEEYDHVQDQVVAG